MFTEVFFVFEGILRCYYAEREEPQPINERQRKSETFAVLDDVFCLFPVDLPTQQGLLVG